MAETTPRPDLAQAQQFGIVTEGRSTADVYSDLVQVATAISKGAGGCTENELKDIIDTEPANVMTISYGASLVLVGNELKPTQVKDVPTHMAWKADPEAFYTVIMTDPDAPSRADPKFREWNHWVVTNIKGGDWKNGETLQEYVGAGPPADTGLHRYIFLVYKQEGKQEFADEKKLTNTSMDGRGGWHVKEFAAKHKLGEPVAYNLFQAQFDDYVPELYKQLGAA